MCCDKKCKAAANLFSTMLIVECFKKGQSHIFSEHYAIKCAYHVRHQTTKPSIVSATATMCHSDLPPPSQLYSSTRILNGDDIHRRWQYASFI